MKERPRQNGGIIIDGRVSGTLPPEPGKISHGKSAGTPTPTSLAKFTLSDLADEWHFFNHGALFCFCGMEYPKNDPVADWYEQQPIGTDIIQQQFKSLLFEGLSLPIRPGRLTWGHVVCACHNEYWDSLSNFLGGVAVVDHKNKLYAQTFAGDIAIADPVLVERYSILRPDIPRVTITMFCADTNKSRWEVRPPLTPLSRPTFVRMDPRPEVIRMGRAVLSGNLAQLQHKDSPEFQRTLDKYKALRGERDNESGNGAANGR